MNHGGFSGVTQNGQQFFLDEAAGADVARHAVIHMAAGINRAFYRADEALCTRPVDALFAHARHLALLPAAFLAELPRPEFHHHVVRAEHLQIVDGLHHRDIFLCPRQNHGRGKLKIDVVEVDDVRVEAVDNLPHFAPRLAGIDDAEGVEQLFRAGRVEVHVDSRQPFGVPDGVFLVVHAEIFHLMTASRQFFPNAEHIRFRPAARVQKLIDHQDFHRFSSLPR